MTRRAFVTGGARGIGRAIVARFEAEGFEVIAPPRSELDLSDLDSVQRYLAGGLEVDVLVNNAGQNVVHPFDAVPLHDFQQTLTTNLTSAFLLMQAALPGMADRGWGRVVNVSSCYSFLGRAGRAPYSASKAALNGVTRTAALEYGARNVLVNAISPGFVETELTRQNNDAAQIAALAAKTALQRLARPEEIAEFAVWLASERNTYVTGQVLVIDGGFSCQ